MTTDIDALVAEVGNLWEHHQHWPYYSRLIAALTAERAKVAAALALSGIGIAWPFKS